MRAPDAGDSAPSQAVSYAFSFFTSDGVPPPAPARVTPTVGQFLKASAKSSEGGMPAKTKRYTIGSDRRFAYP